jgi:VanZ family protein
MASKRILRIGAWLLLFAIAAFSVVSPYYRFTIFVPHDVEHFLAFLLAGVVFGLGYPFRYAAHSAALIVFAAAIELAQLWSPGRHARVSDFVVNALGLCVGMGLAYVVARRQKAVAGE